MYLVQSSASELSPKVEGSVVKAVKNPPIVRVPLCEQARDYSQRVIEFVTDLALAEGRYAVEVLNELLQEQLETPRMAGNGSRLKSKVHSNHG